MRARPRVASRFEAKPRPRELFELAGPSFSPLGIGAPPAQGYLLRPMRQAVVKVFATVQSSNYSSPWQTSMIDSSSGSGVVIAGRRVLTGAHVVADATFLEVQKLSNPDKAIARVLAVCHDSDLALLEVEDAGFLADITPVELGSLPELEDRVTVLGYPVGGEELSITEGVVSRIEAQTYSHSQRRLLAVTVDAAINDGNSGGPVVIDGRIVGIAFQSLEDAENIGEMVPTPVIEHFLRCVQEAREPILPGIGVRWQTMQNATLRAHHQLSEKQSGILVVSVAHGSSAWGVIQAGDVLHSIAGHPIANNGTVQYLDAYRLAWYAILCHYYVGDELDIVITRSGKTQTVRMPLRAPANLVRSENYDRKPTYFVYGGIVFQPLTLDYLREWSRWWEKAPRVLVQAYYEGQRTESCQEVIVLSTVLVDRVNVGYEGIEEAIVARVDGQEPRDMRHFVELVEGGTGHVRIETHGGLAVVLDRAAVAEALPRVLQRYRIPQDRSQDLLS